MLTKQRGAHFFSDLKILTNSIKWINGLKFYWCEMVVIKRLEKQMKYAKRLAKFAKWHADLLGFCIIEGLGLCFFAFNFVCLFFPWRLSDSFFNWIFAGNSRIGVREKKSAQEQQSGVLCLPFQRSIVRCSLKRTELTTYTSINK